MLVSVNGNGSQNGLHASKAVTPALLALCTMKGTLEPPALEPHSDETLKVKLHQRLALKLQSCSTNQSATLVCQRRWQYLIDYRAAKNLGRL